MLYLVLRPPHPFDPRDSEFRSMDNLHECIPIAMHCDTEREAVAYVRSRFPDAVAMPVPVPVGSGEIVLLGFVADPSRPVSDQDDIPFILFVQAMAGGKTAKRSAFDRSLWKVPVIRPELYGECDVDLRATDLEVPSFTKARIGHRDGKQVIYVEVGGIEMSLMFLDPEIQLIVNLSDPTSTPRVDGAREETSRRAVPAAATEVSTTADSARADGQDLGGEAGP